MKTILKWGCLTTIVLSLLGGAGIYFLGKEIWGQVDKSIQNPSKDMVIAVSAEQYVKDYMEDEEGKKYSGKFVEVSGIIKEVGKTYIELEGEKRIVVKFQKDVQTSELKAGESIIIRGFEAGYVKEDGYIQIWKSIVVK
ncbi:OB-fold protein [Bacillus mycoides]|uniref:OB-fold protein n=1 Tax=Bacillus mycoides TaxID=1405 RepID=UPI003F74FAC4